MGKVILFSFPGRYTFIWSCVFIVGRRMGEALFSLGKISCHLCWSLCNVDHWEKAKEKVSGRL